MSTKPLSPGQKAMRAAATWLLETGARALSRAAESMADDVVTSASRARKSVRDWRKSNVGEKPGDLDDEIDVELQ